MFRRQIAAGEFRNQVKNLVGKSADIENLRTCVARLNIDAKIKNVEIRSRVKFRIFLRCLVQSFHRVRLSRRCAKN